MHRFLILNIKVTSDLIFIDVSFANLSHGWKAIPIEAFTVPTLAK